MLNPSAARDAGVGSDRAWVYACDRTQASPYRPLPLRIVCPD